MHTNLAEDACVKLKELIPRQQFDIAIQAAIGAKLFPVKQLRQSEKMWLQNATEVI